MTVFTAPVQYVATPGIPAIFLAGGITGCPDWQAEACEMLEVDPVDILNPRRPDFDVTDPNAAEQQIRWEFDHLAQADVILFWFPASESPQPIALYELGRHVALNRAVAVGCDPGYPRRFDVAWQVGLATAGRLPVHSELAVTVHRARVLCRSKELRRS